MSKQTANILFMVPPLTKYAGFYQELLRDIGSYQNLGNHLIEVGEQAHAVRQFDKLKEIGQILSNIPLKNYGAIGHYFLAVATNRNGNGDQEEARRLYELAADTAPPIFRAKAIMSLAAVSINTGDFRSGHYYYSEAIQAAGFTAVSVDALKGIAVLKAREGYHRLALRELENLMPFIKHAPPQLYFDVLNSYAVELNEAGRKQEARDIIKHVLASPLAFAYPEWQQTAEDLRDTNRSFAVIKPTWTSKAELLRMPQIQRGKPAKAGRLAPVISLPEWKQKMAKDKKGNGGNTDEMSHKDLFFEIMHVISKDTTTREQLRRILEAAIRIISQPDTPKPDDTDGA